MAIRSATINDMAAKLGRDPRHAFDRTSPRRDPPESGSTAAPASAVRVGPAKLLSGVSLVLLAFAGVILALAHYAGAEISRGGHSTDTSAREILIGNDVLEVPANVIRFPTQRRAGDVERLDLYLRWPDMAGYTEEAASDFNSPAVNPAIVFLTIEPRSMTMDMSGRIGPIYSKFLAGPEHDAGHGLKRRALDGDSGYGGEELWYETGSPYPFAARCMAPETPGATPYCLRDIHIGRDLTVTYRFHQSLMGEWMALEKSVRAAIRLWLRG